MARAGLFLVVVAVAFAGFAPGASAHAVLVRSEPSDGSTLARAPHEVWLRFSEAISSRFRVVRVIDGHGRVVSGVRVRGSGSRRLVVSVPRSLGRGAYQLTWEVVADADGHVTGGALAFGVGAKPLVVHDGGGPGAAAAPLEAVLRWIDIAMVAGLIGALAMAALLARVAADAAGAARRARRQVLAVGAGAAAGAVVVGLALLARQIDRVDATVAPGAGAADVLGTRWGALWLAREFLLVALMGVALRLRASEPAGPRGGESRAAWALAAIAVVVLAVVRALAGHAAAAPRPGLAVAAAAAHTVAAGAWLGGVVAFGVALSAAGEEAGTLARACRTHFARAAGLSIAVLAVTGLLAAGAQVASVDALLTTDYGRTLLTKTALAAAAVALGMANALALRRGALPRLLLIEASAGAGILLAAAMLTASPPAKGPEFAPPRPAVARTLVSRAGDLLVTATARPGRAGPNVFGVVAASSRRPPPAPVDGVQLRLTPPGGGPARTVALARVTPGRFAGGAELDADGRWGLTAVVRRGGADVALPFDLAVAAPDPARPVVHSARPLAPLLDGAAAVLALLIGGAAVAVAVLRRPRRPRARSLVHPLGKEAS